MSRGIIYHAVLDENNCGMMSASDFEDCLDVMHIDSVLDQAPEDAADSIANLLSWIKTGKFEIIEKDLPEDCAFIIKTGDAEQLAYCKRQLFARGFEELKKKLDFLSLDTFASDFIEIASIRDILENTYADAVYFDAGTGPGTYTLDGFMRRLEPNKTYFVSANTVWMH